MLTKDLVFYFNKAKEIIKSNKIKLIELAELMDIAKYTLYRWETGSAKPSSNNIRILAQLLEVSVGEISNLKEFPIQNKNILKEKGHSEPAIIKYLYELDKIIEEFGDVPIVNINSLKNLKRACLEYQQQNTALLKKVRHFEEILNHNSSILYIVDSTLKFRYVNQEFIFMSNKSCAENIIGYRASDIFGMNDVYDIIQYEKQVIKEQKPLYNKKISIPCSNGTKKGLLTVHPMINEAGEVIELICTIQDITDVSNLINNLEQLKKAIDVADDYFFSIIKNNKENKYISKTFENITGYKREAFYEDINLWYSIIHPDDAVHLPSLEERLNSEGKARYRIIHKNGRFVWIEAARYIKQDNDTGQTLNFSVVKNITKEVEQNSMLEILKTSLDFSNVGIVVSSLQNNQIVYRNKTIKKLTGCSCSDKTNKNMDFFLKKFITPKNYESILKLNHNTDLKLNKIQDIKCNMPDGKTSDFRIITSNRKYHNEIFQLSIFRDITKEKIKTETDELYKRVINNTNSSIWIINPDRTKYIFISESVSKQYNYPSSKFKKDMNFWINNCVHPEDRTKELKYMTQEIEYPHKRKFRIIRPNGDIRIIKCSLHISNGYLLSHEFDITDE